jgi:protein-S-isoprenylcysteine O-methyltransferase Ste14
MVWIILAIFLWGFGHSFLASNWVKRYFSRHASVKVMRYYRFGYNLFACLSFIPVITLFFFTPDQLIFKLPFPWMLITTLCQVAVLMSLLIGLHRTGSLDLAGLTQLLGSSPEQPVTLKTTGIYHLIRHPIYSVGLAFIWLMPVMTRNSLAIDIGLTAYIVIGSIFEERKLVLAYGEEYTHYQMSTPMLIPFLNWNKKSRNSS